MGSGGMSQNNDEIERRKKLALAQAEGAEALPSQLKRTEVSQQLRTVLWAASTRSHRSRRKADMDLRRRSFMRGDDVLMYGWLQHVLRLRAIPDFDKLIDAILVDCRSPYRVIAPDVIAQWDLADLNSGGREHLKTASGELSAGHFADSARENIHAVDSVDFSKALAKLEARTDIHGGLKRGFTAMYSFTSDQQGIRDALPGEGRRRGGRPIHDRRVFGVHLLSD
jgi:hypothetical protein